MRLSDFCNRLLSRAPCGLFDSWLHLVSRSVLRRPATRTRRLTLGLRVGGLPPIWTPAPDELGARRAACQMSAPGGASLDGEPPASVFATTITRHPRVCPEPEPRTFASGVERGPGRASIDGSSAFHLPVAVFSTARRARDVTSDVLFCTPRRIRHRCRIPIASDRLARLCRRLVKDVDFRRSRDRTPSIVRVLPPPSARDACASARGITRSRPDSLLACWWLSPPRTGFQRFFARGPARISVRAKELDP
jgi:hypothetical protein